MTIPTQFPRLRLATAVLGLYAIVWIALESELWWVLVLAFGTVILAILYFFQRFLGGRTLRLSTWLAATAAAGLVCGAGSVLAALFLMALKTGLHAHGPEFTPAEIVWLWSQLPLWSLVGLVAGLGAGLVVAALANRR